MLRYYSNRLAVAFLRENQCNIETDNAGSKRRMLDALI